MQEILRDLTAENYVLDLGCQQGSFPAEVTRARVIRTDRDLARATATSQIFVCADAALLPFCQGVFAAVIANHSLEHFENLSASLDEIGRVVRSDSTLFVAIPDASTLTDKLYRWISRGGGHVNSFRSLEETARLIEMHVGLPLVATRLLCSSLSFMNRRNVRGRVPGRLLLLGAGIEWTLFAYVWLSRRLDRIFGTRTRVYGWALFFGKVDQPIDTRSWVNVCVRCGSGTSARELRRADLVRTPFPGVPIFACPGCGARNPFAEDFDQDCLRADQPRPSKVR